MTTQTTEATTLGNGGGGRPTSAAVLAELESMAPDASAQVESPPVATDAATATAAAAADPTATGDSPDPETDKRLAVIQRAEERSRQALAKERADALAEIERVKTEVLPLRDQLERFRALQARAKYEPAAVLAELGLDAEDFEHAAKDAYLRSKAAQADPKSKLEVAKAAKDRAHADDLSTLRRELSDLKQQLSQQSERVSHERAVSAYLDSAVKAAGDEMPLLRTLVSKDPTRARADLERLAYELAEASGGPVPAEDVAIAYEQKQRALLESMGIDVATLKRRPTATTAAQPTPPKPAGIPGAAPSGSTAIKPRLSRDEVIAQTIRDLEAGNIPAD